MKTIPETTCFLFVENEVDKRGKLYKTVKEKGRIVELGRQDEKTLLYWIAGNVRKEGRQIKESTARYLVSKTGTDMENLEKELEKLFSYTLPEASLSASDGADHLEGRDKEVSENIEITVKDIDAVCTTQISNKIFDMIEAVAAKHQKKALNYYYDLLALKEPPMRILYLLARQFRILLQVKDLLDRGNDKAQIAKAAKLHPFVAGKYMQQCRTFTSAELKGIMEEAANTEELVKTGRLNDVMSVEIFIVKFSA
ncbi:MAG: DNA polymerase III subunit delta, partial [Lachnospiraceae bacterium]|nr:DNA polymerase III subunit delta [Lachnospiraceae bacterium]